MSTGGVTALAADEGSVDGLYDDPSGYCTFGVGHLVHAAKWSCFLLAAANANTAWQGKLGTIYGISYVPRSAVSWSDYADLKTKAVEQGIDQVAKKQGKDPGKLTDADKTAAKAVAEAGVRVEADLLAKKVEDVLAADLGSYENAVNAAITGVTLTQDEFDALVSICFNIGVTNFKGSTLVKKINENKYRSGTDAGPRQTAITDIENAFAAWNKSGGQVLPGLTKRRKSESDRFLAGARAELTKMKVPVPAKP